MIQPRPWAGASRTLIAAACWLAGTAVALAAPAPGAGLPRYLDTYRELVETNTQLSDGSCTLAAQRMAARLAAAGIPQDDIRVFGDPAHPREYGLFAQITARRPQAAPVLLVAHIDVVEARGADWDTDPFRLVEAQGYYHGRGTSDDKAMAAAWVDTLVRIGEAHLPLRRTIKLALTCGEETEGAFNGAQWLAKAHPDWIAAAFALNEGGAGQLDAEGRQLYLGVEAEEKTRQDYRLVATGSPGHSSLPAPDNAIARLAGALQRIAAHAFPIRLDAVTRDYFTRTAPLVPPEQAAAIRALLRDPADAAALAILQRNRMWNAILHTTCVPTRIAGGSANNALPQSASANVNCRIMPGEAPADIAITLAQLVDDPGIAITMPDGPAPIARAVPLDDAVLGPLRKVAKRYYPGIPVIPTLVSGSTDGAFLGNAGIPTYGVPSFFYDADYGNIHAANERIRVDSVLTGRNMLYDLVLAYAASER